MMVFFVFILIVIFITFLFIYNRIIYLEKRIENAYSVIDISLTKRNNLIPLLVNIVKEYSVYESKIIEDIVKTRNQISKAKTNDEKIYLNNELEKLLIKVFAWGENNPKLLANQNYLKLQNELFELEEELASFRKYYNGTVFQYNTYILKFPNILIKEIFKFKEKKFLERGDFYQK